MSMLLRRHHADPDAGEVTTSADVNGGDSPPPADQFDPAEHTVDDVNAYLAEADDDERGRVLAAEGAGKNRATVKAPAVTS